MQPGEVLAVIGPNGAGKSTLLMTLCGDLSPDEGEISMNGRRLRNWPLRERARLRAVLPQDCQLNFPLTVLDVVLMGRSPYCAGTERPQDRAIAHAALELVDAGHLAQRRYPALSGDEQQRVRLARGLADARFGVFQERADTRHLGVALPEQRDQLMKLRHALADGRTVADDHHAATRRPGEGW
jgi:ABC-type hemin transport system ATPase subunit